MKKTIAALAALSMSLPAAVLAANVNVGIGAGADISAGVSAGASGEAGASQDSNMAANESSSMSGSADVDTVVTAFSSTQSELLAIANVGEGTPVRVVRLDSTTAAQSEAVANARETNTAATAELQAAIEANADLKGSLEAEGIAVDSIVAADLGADGVLTLYAMG